MMNGVHFRVAARSVLPRRMWWRLSLLVLVSPLVAGCGPSALEGEEEAHHEFPPHRPGSYEQLVSDIEQRVTKHQAAGNAPGDDSELQDLAGWIPEFAADSELKRQDFDRAVNLARQLQPELAGGGVLSGDRAERVGKSLQGLRELVLSSRDPNARGEP